MINKSDSNIKFNESLPDFFHDELKEKIQTTQKDEQGQQEWAERMKKLESQRQQKPERKGMDAIFLKFRMFRSFGFTVKIFFISHDNF